VFSQIKMNAIQIHVETMAAVLTVWLTSYAPVEMVGKAKPAI